MKTTRDRFDEKVDRTPGHGPDGECWLWTAGKYSTDDYGCFWYQGRNRLAHRVAYRLHKGEIPDGKLVLHGCDNPPCVNPAHLSLGTYQDNMDQMVKRGRAKPATGDHNGSRTHPEKQVRGGCVGTAKLTADHVLSIRGWYATGAVLQRDLARVYGVSNQQISKIINRQTWSHLLAMRAADHLNR